MSTTPEPEWLTPGEVAQMWRADPKTISRWAKSGKFGNRVRIIRTPGNHRRFHAAEMRALLAAHTESGQS